MKSNQSGFTLIELVIVIVILGVLAATAVPKFLDLSDDAETAALEGVVGGVESGSAINYAAKMASKTYVTVSAGGNCATIVPNLITSFPADYSASGTIAGSAGASSNCTITQTSSTPNKTDTAAIIVTD